MKQSSFLADGTYTSVVPFPYEKEIRTSLHEYRDFSVRLNEFFNLKGFKLIADTLDYVVFETKEGNRFQSSGYAMHLAMLEENIK